MSKILAIDYGAKNIGLALSDDEQRMAFAYGTLIVETQHAASLRKAAARIIDDLKKVCLLEKVASVVVGMPIGLAGRNTKKTEEVFAFVKKLEKVLALPVEVEDERLTTVQAAKLPNTNARNIDELSAQILLQGYLDRLAKTLNTQNL